MKALKKKRGDKLKLIVALQGLQSLGLQFQGIKESSFLHFTQPKSTDYVIGKPYF